MLLIWNFLENQVEMVRLNINCRETTRKSHPWILDLRVFYCVISFTIFEEHVIDMDWLEEEMNRGNRLEKEEEAEEQRRRERERREQLRREGEKSTATETRRDKKGKRKEASETKKSSWQSCREGKKKGNEKRRK